MTKLTAGPYPLDFKKVLDKLVPDRITQTNISSIANSSAYKAYHNGQRFHALHTTSVAKWYPRIEEIMGRVLYAQEIKAFGLMFEFFLQRANREAGLKK